MAAGTQSFMGKALPITGNATITGVTAATDVLTITGAASQSGDFLVVKDSASTEHLVVSSSGLMTVTSFTATGNLTFNGLSSSNLNAITIAVTTTGAIVADITASVANAIYVKSSSKSAFNSVLMYDSLASAAASVSSVNMFLGVNGSLAPDYFLSLGTSTIGQGAAGDNGFLNAGITLTADPTSDSVYAGIKCLFGSKAYYILAVPDSSIT